MPDKKPLRGGTMGRGVRSFPAFTIRLPHAMYAELQARAERNKRSLAAQVEYELEEKFSS
jgi:hypothetical protein